jgi:hypothetical protein
MTLPVVPVTSADEKQHRTVIATSLNELVKFYNTIESGAWTATIRGSGTAGTYEIADQGCRYSRIGRLVFLDVSIIMAGAITAGGTGNLQITGAPYAKMAGTVSQGAIYASGVDYTAGASLSLSFISLAETAILMINQTTDNAAAAAVPVSGLAANDEIYASIVYETDEL